MYPKSNIGQWVSVITKNRFNRHLDNTILVCPRIYNISDGYEIVKNILEAGRLICPLIF